MLEQAACPVCCWQPPPPIPQGSLLWEPVNFTCGVGGPSPESFISPGVTNGTAVFPLRSGELVALAQKDGHIVWRSPEPSPELYPRHLHVEEGGVLLCNIADNRSMELAGNGFLARLDPRSGAMDKIWSGYGYSMTEPVFTGNKIIVRTARPKLVALNRNNPGKIEWEVPLKTYKPVSPAISQNFVFAWDGEVTKNQMLLKAFSLETGKLAWQTNTGEIDTTPLVVGDQLIYRMNKRVLTSINMVDGKQLWQKKFDKIYSPPILSAGKLYLVVCGSEDVTAAERYCLQCLNPATGECEWQNPVGFRAQEIVGLLDGNLLLGMGDPNLAICSVKDGHIQWQYNFGSEKINRVQSHLIVEDGILWVGTYEGLVAAIRIAEPAKEMDSPKKYLDGGYFESAALAYARKGNWVKAAELFMEKLEQPRKALAIYEHIGDVLGQAEALLVLGDELGAAKLLQKAGKLTDSAPLFEKTGEFRTAMHIYQELGDEKEFARLRRQVPLEFSDVEQLEKENKLSDAGKAALQLEDYRKAVDLFTRAGDSEKENLFNTLTRLCELEPEPWSLNSLAELSRSLGRFKDQAQALEKQGIMDKAAEAYMFAAQQAEIKSPNETATISGLYAQAYKYFVQEGYPKEQKECWGKILKYNKLPWIQITGHSEEDKAFRECQFNTLTLEVKNVGFGRASKIDVQIQSERFEVDRNSIPEPISALSAGKAEIIYLPIRPLEAQVGEVPFTLAWHWQDNLSRNYNDKTAVTVSVKKQDDARTGGTPVYIQAGGQYIQHVDELKHVGGDLLEKGSQIGDNFSFNQKDVSGTVSTTMYCPNCELPVPEGNNFCEKCGYAL